MPSPSYLFAGVAGYVGRPEAKGEVGVFRRALDGGDGAWTHVLADLETYSALVHPGDPSVVLAGTQDGVYISTDHGATFASSQFPDSGQQIWCFLVDSRSDDTIFAGASPINVYRSDDRGQSWRRLPDPAMPEHCKVIFDARVMRMVQHPTRPDEIYAALEVNGVMRTDDSGESWRDCSAHLIELSGKEHLKSKIVSDTFSEGMLDVHAITISCAKPDEVILALRMGLFRSVDKGGTWQDMEVGRFSPTTYGRDIKASPHDPNTLYAALSVAAASHDGGIYRSTDAGTTWQRFDKVQVNGTIMSVCLHPRDADQVYIGARYNGEIFGTSDGGATWQPIPLPGHVKDIYCLSCG